VTPLTEHAEVAVGLDLGSAFTRVLICGIDDGTIHYLGHSAVQSRGWIRGQIADPIAAAEDIRQAVAEAEGRAGLQIGSATVGAGGPMVRCSQARGTYDFGHRRPVDRDDMRYAIDLASRSHLDEGRVLLQVAPQDFTLDGKPAIPYPLNIECSRLEAHALLVTTADQDHQAILSVVHQAHLKVEDTVFEAMAAAYASVLPEERASGVCVIDIGAQSTQMVIYDGDSMIYATGMPISGEHFSRDVGELKGLTLEEAELLKTRYGCTLPALTADNVLIELPAEGGRQARQVLQRSLNEILEARALQLFGMVESRRQKFAPDIGLREGVALTGAASRLEGMVDVAERTMSCPARLGFPRGIDLLPDDLMTPAWTVASGLAMYSGRLHARGEKRPFSGPSLRSLLPVRR
jgi:cell division protein FtsA